MTSCSDDAWWQQEIAAMQREAKVLADRLERLGEMATARGAARHMAGALGQVMWLERSMRTFIESTGITITKLGKEEAIRAIRASEGPKGTKLTAPRALRPRSWEG